MGAKSREMRMYLQIILEIPSLTPAKQPENCVAMLDEPKGWAKGVVCSVAIFLPQRFFMVFEEAEIALVQYIAVTPLEMKGFHQKVP